MSLEIVTGYKGTNHVTAAQISDLQAGFAGYESCVLPIGNKLKAEAVTANKVRIFDGVLLHYGRQAMITAGAYEDVTIENGTSGLNRNDFIVARYVKDDQTGIEDFSLSVLKGQPGSTATDPTPTAGNIRTGALESEMLLYRVKLNGLAIEAVEPLFHVMVSAKELKDNLKYTKLTETLNTSTANTNITLTDSVDNYKELLFLFGTPSSTTFGWYTAIIRQWVETGWQYSQTGRIAIPVPGGTAIFKMVSETTIQLVSTDLNIRAIYGKKL